MKIWRHRRSEELANLEPGAHEQPNAE